MSDDLRKFGPKDNAAPSIGDPCRACGAVFKAGDYTTLIALGPGDDKEAQDKAARGGFYNAVAIEVHWACATGEREPES